MNGNDNRFRMYIYIPNMAEEEGSGCTCTMDDVVQDAHIIRFVGDPQPGEFELPTAGDVEWLLFSYT